MTDTWKDAQSLEEAFRNLIKCGEREKALALVKFLPVERKEKYRKIWLEETGAIHAVESKPEILKSADAVSSESLAPK